jgi:hypothetical protein
LLQAAAAAAAKHEDPAAAMAIKQQLQAEVKALAVNYVTKQKALLADVLPGGSLQAKSAMGAAAGPAAAAGGGSGGSGGKGARGGQQGEEFDGELLTGFLERLSDFDTQMNQVVVDAGVLAGEREVRGREREGDTAEWGEGGEA